MISHPLTGRLLTVYGDRVGFAVAGAWLSLLLFGRWRPERTSIAQLCRVMGWIWLSLALMIWLRSCCSMKLQPLAITSRGWATADELNGRLALLPRA